MDRVDNPSRKPGPCIIWKNLMKLPGLMSTLTPAAFQYSAFCQPGDGTREKN